jgi:transposase
VLAFRLTAGQVNECTVFTELLDDIAVPGVSGGVRRRPEAVAGDKGYSTGPVRCWCRAHRVRAVIPERPDQREQRAHRRGRKPSFDPQAYRGRNIVERVVGWIKQSRPVAFRAEKLATRYAAMVTLALITRTARYLSDTT